MEIFANLKVRSSEMTNPKIIHKLILAAIVLALVAGHSWLPLAFEHTEAAGRSKVGQRREDGLTTSQQVFAPVHREASAGSLTFAPAPVTAAWTVTSTNDLSDGSCDVGHCSLREAIVAAAPGDEIRFASPLFDVPQVITLTSGELVIDKNLTITGPDANLLTISGGNTSRVFFINPSAAGAVNPPAPPFPVVHLSNLTIANGKAQGGNGGKGLQRAAGGGGGAGMGGGIFINGATVTIDRVAFDHNQALGGKGGDTADFSGFAGGGGGGGTAGNGTETGNGSGNVLIGGNGGGGGSFGGNGGPGGPEYGSGDDGGEGSGAGGNGGNFSGSFAGNQSFAAGNGGFGGGGAGGAKRRVPDGSSAGGAGGFGGGGGGGINGLAPGGGGSFGGAGGNGAPQGGSGGGGGGLGGAIFVRAGNLVLQNSIFSSNSTTGGNGGTPCCAPAGSRGQGKGGAVFIHTDATAGAASITFNSNTAPDAAGTPTDNHDIYGLLQQPPVANDQVVTVPEDTATPITLGATDPNPNDLTYTILSGPTHGTLTGSGNSYAYTPGLNYNGPDSVTFTANNGAFESNTATVSIAVNAANDAPSFARGADQSAAEDSGAQTVVNWASGISAGPPDESGQTVIFVVQGNTNPDLLSAGPAISSTGTLSYTPAANANGSTTITLALMDNGGGGDTSPSQTFVITVTAINDAPNSGDDLIASMSEDSGIRTIPIASLLGNDSAGANEDGQTLTLTGVDSAVGGTVTIDATNVYFSPAADFNGAASFHYTITDNGTTGSSAIADPRIATASVSFTVTEVNDAPTANGETISGVAEDSGQFTIPFAILTANDTKGPANESSQTLVVNTISNPVGGTVSLAGDNVLFTPTANYFGPAGFDYTVEDNGTSNGEAAPLSSGTATAGFNVTEVNDTPQAVNDSPGSVAEDSGIRTIPIASLLSNDVERTGGGADENGQMLTFSLVGSPLGGTVSSDATNVYFNPAANFNGPASFQYMVTDNGTTNGVPDPKSDTASVSFMITEVNDQPVVLNDVLGNMPEDSVMRTIAIASLLANDSKGAANEEVQTLSFTLISGSEVGGTAGSDGITVFFTPAANYHGPASFEYRTGDNGTTNGVADPQVSGTATVNFSLTDVNDAPTAVNDLLTSVVEDSGQRTIPFSPLTANDTTGPANESGQGLLVKTVSNPVGGTVNLVGGNVLFTPTADYNGPASFQYTVEDNGTTNSSPDPLTSATATVSFTITEINDAPVTVNDTLGNSVEDSAPRAISFADLTGNDSRGASNESGQKLTVITANNAVGGTVDLVPGFIVFTPTADYNGPASFAYVVYDNGTSNEVADPKASGSATVQFNITAVNDAPAAVNDTLGNVAEDSGERTIAFADLTGNDIKGPADESGQSMLVNTVGNPVGVTVSIVDGTVRITPLPDYNGAASFQYTIRDNGTTSGFGDEKVSGVATASFNINAAADTPSVTNATTNANTQTTSSLLVSRNPADGAEVTHFRVSGITGGLLFRNNGTTPIHNGDFITFAEGDAGLKFTPGTTNGSFQVQASISASDADLGGETATGIITVNSVGGVIRFSTDNYSVAESAGFRTITVERTGDASQAVAVDYATSDHSETPNLMPCNSPGAGFASSRCDFTTALGTLRFASGETSKTFNVLISDDNYVEGPETLELTLSNPMGDAVFGVPQMAILSITDDVSEPATNPIDNAADFVRAQYHDVLGREPDAAGLAFWVDNIEKCTDPARRPAGLTVEQCVDKQRESTAVAFFMSPEFQITGGFVHHLYKGSLTGAPNYDGGSPGSGLGRFPTSLEFMRDVSAVSKGIVVNNQISGAVVEANRNRLAAEFVQRPEFVAKYGGLSNTLYVDELFNTTGITPTAAEKQALVAGLNDATETRASVLRKVVDGTVVISESNVQFTTTYGQAFSTQEYRRVFVYMEYVGYLRRKPDAAGFGFWLGKLDFYNGDPFQAEMVRAFILSPEYRQRFGQ
jgi:CSLREA domain-containing protein